MITMKPYNKCIPNDYLASRIASPAIDVILFGHL